MGFSVLTMAFQVWRPSVALCSSCFIYFQFLRVFMFTLPILTLLIKLTLLFYWRRIWVKELELPPTGLSTESGRPKPECKAHRHNRPWAVKAGEQWRTYGTLSSIPHLYTCSQRKVCPHKITTIRDLVERKHQFLFLSLCVSLCGHVYM